LSTYEEKEKNLEKEREKKDGDVKVDKKRKGVFAYF